MFQKTQKTTLNATPHFDEYDAECVTDILIDRIDRRNFKADVKRENMLNAVRGATARGMAQEFPNALLARKLLNDAIARQTERVYMNGTMSWEGLTALCEDDFLQEHKVRCRILP